jgi:Mn2+/Fe2+ NRAMP family transporter
VNAGLLGIMVGSAVRVDVLAFGIMLGCAFLLISGGYQLLAGTIKWVVVLLTITTVVALGAAIVKFDPAQITVTKDFGWSNKTDITFLIALMGWMPAPIDLSVWHSGWTLAEKKANPALSIAGVTWDFQVGYWGTTLLGVMFLALGALSLYGKGEVLPEQSIPFAARLINLYTANIGGWSYGVIMVAAFTTMFSTSLTVLDGYARTVVDGLILIKPTIVRYERYWYLTIVMVTVLGAQGILSFASGNMRALVQFATVVSFVTAPILAGMNFWVMNREPVPMSLRPSRWEWLCSLLGGLFLVVFTVFYLWQTFGG